MGEHVCLCACSSVAFEPAAVLLLCFLSIQIALGEVDRTEATSVHSSATKGQSGLLWAHFVLIFFGEHQRMTPNLSLCYNAPSAGLNRWKQHFVKRGPWNGFSDSNDNYQKLIVALFVHAFDAERAQILLFLLWNVE